MDVLLVAGQTPGDAALLTVTSVSTVAVEADAITTTVVPEGNVVAVTPVVWATAVVVADETA
jgi:hypothetical protein